LVNERSVRISQEAKKLKVSKKKLEEHSDKLQKTMEELGRRNYHLEKEGRILKGLVKNYQSSNQMLEGFLLSVFILGQLVVGLYLLDFFDENDICITIF